MSSIFRRLISGKIASPILRRRKFCTTTAAESLRPSWPCLMLPHHFIGGGTDMVYNFYSPMKDEVVSFNNRGGSEESQLMQDDKTTLVGSSHGWLALYNSRNRSMCLLNPVSGRRIDLPPVAGKPFFGEQTPQKLVMSGPPDEEDCRAVMTLEKGAETAFCRPGRSSQWAPLGKWSLHECIVRVMNGFIPEYDSISEYGDLRFYTDFVYSAARKRFVALIISLSSKELDLRCEVEYWDISEPSCPKMDRVELLRHCPINLFAWMDIVCAGESDQLFLVARRKPNPAMLLDSINNEEDLEFHHDVYRIEDGGDLELCSSLDDLTIFVGINSIASPYSPKLKRNCIYLANRRWNIDGQYIEIFDYKNKSCSPLYFPNRHHKNLTTMTWITPTYG